MSRKNNFMTKIPVPQIPRNKFDLSHEVKTTGRFGFIYPILTLPVMPGDTVNDTVIAHIRAAPMLAPPMHRIIIKSEAWFVPTRILNNHFEEWSTGGEDGMSSVVMPFITPAGAHLALGGGESYFTKNSLWNCMGGPALESPSPTNWSTEQLSIFPWLTYQKIYTDWYRDPNLETEFAIDDTIDSQGDVSAMLSTHAWWLQLRQCGWERDLYTGALPWPQRGPEVLMPIGAIGTPNYSAATSIVGGAAITEGPAEFGPLLSGTIKSLRDSVSAQNLQVQNLTDVTVDNATTTINDLRAALAMQAWMEVSARSGGRYPDMVRAQYGKNVPDYRVQRAEFLGAGRQTLTISEVLATAETTGVPVGDMAGHGIAVGRLNKFSYTCDEHGIVMVMVRIVPEPVWMQGLPRLFKLESRFDDLAFAKLANLGEQEMLSKEVYFNFDGDDDDGNNMLFGYVPRYAQFKIIQNRVAGDFTDTLLFWHLARKFNERPALNPQLQYVQDDGGADLEEPLTRIFAVEDGTDYFWMQFFHRMPTTRPLPYYGVPQMIG